VNKVMLVGRLTRDPELKTTGTGKSVATFSLAVDRRFKSEGQPTADFFNIVAWGKQAEIICQYLSKGRQLAISGRLQTRSYTAQDNTKRYVTEVVLEEFTFIGSARDSSYRDNDVSSQREPASSGLPMDDFDDEFKILGDDDDVPF